MKAKLKVFGIQGTLSLIITIVFVIVFGTSIPVAILFTALFLAKDWIGITTGGADNG